MTELFSYQQPEISLAEAMQLPLPTSYGLFYTPTQCLFGLWDGKKISDAQDKPIDLEQVFEAHLFNSNLELRWLKGFNPDNLGNAVYLFENTQKNKLNWEQLPTLNDLSIHENQYLLWGEYWQADDLAANWSCIATSRIGKLLVPIANLQKNQRVVLKTREYFGLPDNVAGEHGNKVVLEERWLGLEAY
jgi:CRISPR-associated protein (TIGR03984 family)